MKRAVVILLVIISISVLYLGVLFIVGGDVVENNYRTYEEAKKDKLFIRGWLPDILPATTISIKTVNNLDLNFSNGGFTILREDMDEFKSKTTRIDDKTYSYTENEGATKWIFVVNNKTGYVSYEFE